MLTKGKPHLQFAGGEGRGDGAVREISVTLLGAKLMTWATDTYRKKVQKEVQCLL